MFTAADVIYAHTRARAIEATVLVDVSGQVREAGFCIPVALTERVWTECVEWPETEAAIQDESAGYGTSCSLPPSPLEPLPVATPIDTP